jgi:drug/metabolite transporter (DMT)-like permease
MKSNKNSPNISPIIILIMGIIAVSTSSIIIRYAQKEVPSLVIAAFRLVIAALILGIVVAFRYRNIIRGLTIKQVIILSLSGLFLAGHFATWITSLEYTSIVSSVVLVCSTPLWVGLLSPLVVREKPGRIIWLGMALTLVGAVIVGMSSSLHYSNGELQFEGFGQADATRAMFGNILALLGALSETGYILIGRGVRKNIALVPYTFIVYGSGALFMLIAVLGMGLKMSGYSIQSYEWMTALAIVPQLIGHTSFNWALGYLNAAFVSVALLGEPVGTSILSFLLLKETPTVFEAAGGLFILVGIYITSRSEGK